MISFLRIASLGIVLLWAQCSFGKLQETQIMGIPYVSLRSVGQAIGMPLKIITPLQSVSLCSNAGQALFTLHKRDAVLNGTRVYFGNPIALNGSQLYTSALDYDKTLRPILYPQAFVSKLPKVPKRIMLDPGHGGKDTGAEDKALGLQEKALTLDLALRLKKMLEARGFEVFLTRSSDVFVELKERPAKAKQVQADLFISLHFNAATAKQAQGIETYALTPSGQASSADSNLSASDGTINAGNTFDLASTWLGYTVQTALVKRMPGVVDRGFKRARFVVLRELSCPGILIEGGFVSNPTEAAQLQQPEYRQKLADSIVAGVQGYVEGLQRLGKKTG